ncbi:MAG: UDP-N-acetylmuramate--L-alanine ligase [Parcubacteria group bacterium]|nr:UDP-N-acetylmuramate--L-alanine ligase [Parcubacteria group bacterium]
MSFIHFIGIGGIGVSSLARYYLATGWKVSGSDAARSEITDDLKKRGARIFIGQRAKNIGQADLVVYSAAIKPENPELAAAVAAGVKTFTYAQAVGELTKKYFTIAVAGSHGKSTTTALIGLIMIKAGLDPTIIVGTKLRELEGPPFLEGRSFSGGNNFRLGQSQYLVLEADEYARSFHNYHPKIAVLTNIDKEHLDVYKNLAGVLAGFKKYISNVQSDGYIVANREDENIGRIIKSEARKSQSETNNKSQKINANIIWYQQGKHKLSIPGIHNQFNAEAAWQAVKLLGVKKSVAEKVFKSYSGAWRRLELIYPNKLTKLKAESCIYSDYAHHPTEIKATLQALREKYPGKKLVCVFQPHQQDRLNRLFREFTTAFGAADKTILYPLYKVRGRDSTGKTSEDLVRAVNKSSIIYANNFKKVIKLIEPETKFGSVIVFMSAGDLDSRVRSFLRSDLLS